MEKKVKLLFCIFCIFCIFVICYNPAFGLIDDHTLVSGVLIGKDIPLFIQPEIGRFYPLDGQEWNVLSKIFSPSAYVFYFFNALMFIVVVFCLFKSFLMIYKDYIANAKVLALFLVFLIIITPAFMTSWVRLFVPERMEFVFLSLFLYTYITLYTKSTKRVKFYSLLCCIFSFVALFYKETAFILLGIFAFFHILLSFLSKEKIFKIDYLILLNCVFWFICYLYFVVLQKTGDVSYGDSTYNRILVFARDVLNYSLNDPFLTLGVFVALLYRCYFIIKKRGKIYPFYDSMLISSFVFVTCYLYLGISDLHYLLPAYIFAIPSLVFFVKEYIKNKSFKYLLAGITFIFVFNSIPLSIYYTLHYKFVPNNFQDTLLFLKEYITKKDTKVDIFLEGVNRASSIQVYVSFQDWMNFYGMKNFDFFSDIPIDHSILGKPNPNSPYSVFKSNDIVEKKSGDLVILVPYTSSLVNYSVIDEMQKQYHLIHKSDYGWNIPLLNLRTLIKWIGIQVTKDRSDFAFSHNIFGLPLYFYVFEVR